MIRIEVLRSHHEWETTLEITSHGMNQHNFPDQFRSRVVLSDHMLRGIPFGKVLDMEVQRHLRQKADMEFKRWKEGR